MLTVDQFSERLAISRAQAWKLIKSGKVPSINVGTSPKRPQIRIPVEGVEKFIDDQLKKSVS